MSVLCRWHGFRSSVQLATHTVGKPGSRRSDVLVPRSGAAAGCSSLHKGHRSVTWCCCHYYLPTTLLLTMLSPTTEHASFLGHRTVLATETFLLLDLESGAICHRNCDTWISTLDNSETCWNLISLGLGQPRRIVTFWLLRLRSSLTCSESTSVIIIIIFPLLCLSSSTISIRTVMIVLWPWWSLLIHDTCTQMQHRAVVSNHYVVLQLTSEWLGAQAKSDSKEIYTQWVKTNMSHVHIIME